MATITEVESSTHALMMFKATGIPVGDALHVKGETEEGYMESVFTRTGETEVEVSQTLNGLPQSIKDAWSYQSIARYGVMGVLGGSTFDEIGLSQEFYAEHLSEDDKAFTDELGLFTSVEVNE